jgi:hypothetical protein
VPFTIVLTLYSERDASYICMCPIPASIAKGTITHCTVLVR